MKHLIIVSLLLACGKEFVEIKEMSNCQPYDSDYSHTITYCGEPHPTNVQNMFVLCNPRELETENCADDLVLQELEDNCFATNICLGDNIHEPL